MATIDRTRIAKPSPIVEDEQGQLRARQGISREVVAELSKVKEEPDWMADKRLRSLEIFERKPMPTWGVDLHQPGRGPRRNQADLRGPRQPRGRARAPGRGSGRVAPGAGV